MNHELFSKFKINTQATILLLIKLNYHTDIS